MNTNIFYTKFSELSANRLDPLYYSGEVNGFFKRIKYPLKSLFNLIIKIDSGMGAGKDDQSDSDKGILHLRPTNIDRNGHLKLDRNIYIPFNAKYSKVEKEDILFNNTNSQELVGKTLFMDNNIDAYYSNHMTRIKVNEEIEAKYLWIILNLYQKNKIFFNLCTNWNNQSGIGIDLLKNLKIPIPDKEIQKQIIKNLENVIKEKEAKEKEAKEKLDSIDIYLLKELGIEPSYDEKESLEDRVFLRKFSEVSGERIDTTFHKSTFKIMMKNIQNNTYVKLKEIVTFSSEIWDQKSYFEDEFPYIEISEIDIFSGAVKNINYVAVNQAPSRAKMIIRDNDIIISTTRPNRGAISLIKTDNLLIASTGFSVIRNISDKIQREFLFKLLKSSIVLNQFDQRSSGGNYPAITQEEIGKVLIPLPPIEIQNKIAVHIQALRNEAQVLKDEAMQIYDNAKKEVENMILGNKDE